ncbi:M20 family metallopeptidase [Cohnella faecalis]|uniref:Amidohydrolase n=1 Tax=Cohnella faecalis TaxID=2315694 RepID=A0A398CZ69_9BACL|nr:M20 family metallopeptidase [Cohnella faecalis]RIE05147.1 amidohydrolase [Cohnella faecalis]
MRISKEEIMDAAKKLEPRLIAFRRDLHENPELSLEETETAAKVAAFLRSIGLSPKLEVGGHGVIADVVGSTPGPTIALRADMDALPIMEETGLPFASNRPGIMHACGHDAHTAIVLGAASILVERKERLAGTVRLLFQGAEEINAGAKAMIRDGALDGVDEIYGLHNLPTLAVGMAATRKGPLMGSVDRIELTLEGRGAHGAIPDQGADPIVAAAAVISGLQTIVSREVSPFSPVVVTIGSIHAGQANNVIPHRAEMTGTVRAFDPAVRRQLPDRLRRIAVRIAEAHRCEAELRYIEQVPVLVSEDGCLAHAQRTIDWLLGAERHAEAAPTLAGEDFSVYLESVPGCFFWLGSGPSDRAEDAYGLHHPKFDIQEEALAVGSAALASIALLRGQSNHSLLL